MRRGSEVSILLAMLRRRRWVIAGALLVGLVVALLLGVSTSRYRAEAQLLIGGPGTGSTDAQSLERNLNSQLSVLRSRATAGDVASRLAGDVTAAEVQRATTITQVAGSDVVQVESVAGDPVTAAAIADAYVQVYLANSRTRSQERIAPELERLTARLADLRAQITETNEELARAVAPYLADPRGSVPDPRSVAPQAAAQQQLLLNEYDRVLGQREELQSQEQLLTVSSVLQEAAVDDEPLGPDRQRQVSLVVLAGLAGVALALLLEVRSGRPVDPAEVEEALGVPLAGRFEADPRLRRSPVDLLDLERLPSEDQRTLWLKVDRLSPRSGPALLVVTGVAPRAGTTTLALMLAEQLARSGRRTVLVDAVGGSGSVSEQLGLGGPGLVEARDRSGLDRAVGPASGRLDVVRHGDASRRVDRDGLEAAVRGLSPSYEAVVVDAEPGLAGAAGVAQDAHAVVLVVDQRHADVETLQEWGLALAHLRDRLLPVLDSPVSRRGRSAPSVPEGRPEPAFAGARR